MFLPLKLVYYIAINIGDYIKDINYLVLLFFISITLFLIGLLIKKKKIILYISFFFITYGFTELYFSKIYNNPLKNIIEYKSSKGEIISDILGYAPCKDQIISIKRYFVKKKKNIFVIMLIIPLIQMDFEKLQLLLLNLKQKAFCFLGVHILSVKD